MRRTTGGGGGGAGRRRETRSGTRLSVSAPPPPPRALLLKKHSKKSEGTSLIGVVRGARKNIKSPAAPSSSTSRRPTLLRVVGDATRDAQRPADVSDHHNTILKTTRTRKPQKNTTQRPSTAARRTVRFDRCVRMVLVPARRDLDAAIVDGVWWGAEDVAEFRMAAAKHLFKHGGRRMMARRSSSVGDGGDATPPEEVPGKLGDGAKPPISTPAPSSPLPDNNVVVG